MLRGVSDAIFGASEPGPRPRGASKPRGSSPKSVARARVDDDDDELALLACGAIDLDAPLNWAALGTEGDEAAPLRRAANSAAVEHYAGLLVQLGNLFTSSDARADADADGRARVGRSGPMRAAQRRQALTLLARCHGDLARVLELHNTLMDEELSTAASGALARARVRSNCWSRPCCAARPQRSIALSPRMARAGNLRWRRTCAPRSS